jgi:hypothetical protein
MNYEVKLTWKFFLRILGARELASGDSTQIFRVRTGKSLLRDVGGTPQTGFFPWVLEPSGPFFSKVVKTAKLASITPQKTWFETTTAVFGGGQQLPFSGTYALRLYDDELCVSLDTSSFLLESLHELSAAVNLPVSAPIRAFAARIAEVVRIELGGSGVGSAELKVYPCLRVVAQPGAEPIQLARLTELLTRHALPSQGVIEEVYAKNRDHQVDGTLVLLDRQGLICYAPPTAHTDERASCDRRFISCSALLELAAAIQRLGLQHSKSALLCAADELVANPKRAIPNSTSASRAWRLLVDEFSLGPAAVQKASRSPISTPITAAHRAAGNTILCIAAATIELSAVITRSMERSCYLIGRD